jgi:proteasome activator subunit 4
MSDSSDSSESSDNEQLDQPMAIDENEQNDEEELNRLQENEFNMKNADLKSLQHVDVFLKQLPYFDQIKKFGFETFREIKHNILKSVVLNEIRPGILHMTNRLTLFIHEYGLFFTKEEHIMLIKLYIGIITTPNIDLPIVDICCNLLIQLLKKFDKIERSELIIDWRPIYELYLRVRKIDDNSTELSPENLEQHNLGDFIKCARVYFDVNATQEMLNEWRPMMCLFDTALNDAFMLFKLFLPTILYEHELRFGFELWAFEFLDFWSTFNTRQYWEAHFIRLYSRLAQDNIGLIDWNPYIPFIFSNLLKGFGLPFGSKDANSIESSNVSASTLNVMSHIFTYSPHEISSISVWIVSMIGSGPNRNLCMQYIEKLINSLRSYYYPSNVGSWTSNLMLFLKSLPDALIKRIRNERRSQNKWYYVSVDKSRLISDEDRIQFVQALKDVTFTAMFSKSNQNDARKALQYLTFLRGDIMLPPLIDKINESFSMLNEPHRYTSILSCMVSVSRELTAFNPRHKIQTQLHVLNLLNAVLPGLDPNDSNKCILSLQFISYVLGSVLVCDCSPAINFRSDLSEHEREMCFETSKFEDFIHEFFKRIFNIIENLASDTSSESSASATAASTQFAIKNKGSDENAYQAYILQTVRILTRQSSKNFLKLILNKIKNFINGNSYNIRTGRILASICGSLARSGLGHEAFETFLNYVYENLSKLKLSSSYEQTLRNERGDLEVTWNFQLLSELLKCDGTIIVNHMERIGNLISWFRESINKETFGFIGNCFRELLLSLTHIYPKETCLVDYSLMYDDEKEFFSKHLPIRDWSRRANIYRLNINYHIPSSQELQCAIDFLTLNLNKSEEFLNKSILTEANTLTTSTKEERHREFTYINYLVYGSSRLLKRPSSQPYVNEQLDSSIDVGLSDDINKGLGFETFNLNNPAHEYFHLSKEQKDAMLNMREHIITLMIKYSEKLLEKHSHEVALLSQITQILCTADIIYGYHLNEYEKMWKAYFANQALLKNKLYGKRSCLRDELINRIMLQYQLRMYHIHTRLNHVDIKVIDTLFKLSVDSVYAVVRRNAQNALFSLLSHYPYSNLVIMSKLVELLRRCSDPSKENRLTHDQLKGCLYILKGNSSHESLIIRPNWFVLSTYWPLLLRIQNVEKPSAQALLDKMYYNANKEFDSFDNRIQLSDSCVKLALEADEALRESFSNNQVIRLEQFYVKSRKDTETIRGLMNEMISIASESQLSWKNQSTSFGSIIFLLNSCHMTPDLLTTEVVQLFTNSMVHENINVRKIALDTICILLKMVKPSKTKQNYETFQLIREETQNAINDPSQVAINKAMPGYREDNKWHSYDPNFIQNIQNPDDEHEERKWQSTHFLDKTYWGYYCWPSKLNVNVNKRQSFHSEQNLKSNPFGQAIRPLIDKFKNDSHFVQKFIQLSTIEHSKGNEKFDKKKFYLFKALFRNYGSCEIFNNLFDHLNALITDKKTETQECSHKLAAELVSGLIRGSKYWPLRQLKELWTKLRPILDLMVDNLSNENIGLWSSCFYTAFVICLFYYLFLR